MNTEQYKNTYSNKLLDLVIAGPDFSGTTTQVNDITEYFKNKNLTVKDLRGTEIDALFHAEKFAGLNQKYSSLKEFLDNGKIMQYIRKTIFLKEAHNLLSGKNNASDLLVASMVKNNCSTYINPNSSDVWILEEPTRRAAGQMNRVIEQNRSQFNSKFDAHSAALAHQAYRTDEFLRFRKPLRDANKIIIRSRSEESACYQIYDKEDLVHGISCIEYLSLPGHKIAFANPPTDIFVVCGPENWNREDYLALKSVRVKARIQTDDYEDDVSYQLLVNRRYASDWLENLYAKGCQQYSSKEPTIHRIDIYHSKEEIKKEMNTLLDNILKR